MTELVAALSRYAKLIEELLAAPATPRLDLEGATSVQVERGVVLTHAVMDRPADDFAIVNRLIEVAKSDRLRTLAVIDAAGHLRPVYRPLLVYAWLSAFRIQYEKLPRDEFGRWDEALRAWSDLLESELETIGLAAAATPASQGAPAAEAAWTALALHVAGKVFVRDAWTDLAADTFGRLTRGQQANGAFLVSTPSDNPELVWYHELAILHAAASFAVQAEDRTVARSVAASSNFIAAEIQPDHASSEPWALFAFIWNPATRPLADQILHTATAASSDVSLILLADALYCVRLFL